MSIEDKIIDVKDKIFMFDRSKSMNHKKFYLMIRAGEEVHVKAQTGITKFCKLRIVLDEFVVCSRFLLGTLHKPIESRCDGVYKLPHLVYEQWEEDKEELEDPREYKVVCLKAGTIIPPSMLEELRKQSKLMFY